MKVIAHRGASGNFPENTILACDKAFEVGADIVEIDIQMTKDAQLVVFHDRDALRVANDPRGMAELTYREAKELDVGTWKGFPKISPPFLEEILERKYPSLIIELIPQNFPLESDHYLEKRLLTHLERYNTDLGAGYISVRTVDSYQFLKENSSYPVGLMQKKRPPWEFIDLVREYGIEFSQIRWKTFDDEYWEMLKETDTKITCFYADTPEEWRSLCSRNVYGILTNYPGKLKAFLKSKKQPTI